MVPRMDSPADLGIPLWFIQWPKPRTTKSTKYTKETAGLAIMDQLRGFKEIVVAGRIQCKPLHALGVNEHVVLVPEIDIGKLLCENPLNLCVRLFARILIEFAARLVDQCVDARI